MAPVSAWLAGRHDSAFAVWEVLQLAALQNQNRLNCRNNLHYSQIGFQGTSFSRRDKVKQQNIHKAKSTNLI